nr:hypothetical protein CFP56_52147 [Quercus suber]
MEAIPLRGRKPWLAAALRPGHGPRMSATPGAENAWSDARQSCIWHRSILPEDLPPVMSMNWSSSLKVKQGRGLWRKCQSSISQTTVGSTYPQLVCALLRPRESWRLRSLVAAARVSGSFRAVGKAQTELTMLENRRVVFMMNDFRSDSQGWECTAAYAKIACPSSRRATRHPSVFDDDRRTVVAAGSPLGRKQDRSDVRVLTSCMEQRAARSERHARR